MSTMYKLTRQEAADKLNISTRSLDRYIKAWKLRSKKEWKIVYINDNDINNILWNWEQKQEIIIEKVVKSNPVSNQNESKTIIRQEDSANQTLNQIYKDLKEEIVKKDEIIRDLSIRVWKAEEIASNSISLMEYKKSQFLLEESKSYLNKEIEDIKKEKEQLKNDLKYEKNSNILLIIFVIILLAIASTIWFMKI